MDPKVQAFIEAGKKSEKEQLFNDRREILISLGLFTLGEEERCAENRDADDVWDFLNKEWIHREKIVPDVTEEEFQEILKSAEIQGKSKTAKVEADGAEKYLALISKVFLVAAILCDFAVVGIIFSDMWHKGVTILVVIAVSLVFYFNWALIKMLCNMSNNLSSINRKIK